MNAIKIFAVTILLLSASLHGQSGQGPNPVLVPTKQRALITGVSRGIGFALAHNLLQRGIEVLGIARTDRSQISQLITSPGFTYLSLDLATNNGLYSLQEFIKTQKLTFDFVIHNAGMMMTPQTLDAMSTDIMEQTIQLNLLAPMKLSHILAPFYQSHSRILNITSPAATRATAQEGPYCISKAGLNVLTQVLRKELEPRSIAVAGVIPGQVDTDMQFILRNTQTFHLQQKFHDNFIHGLLISPDICADFLSWLLCEMPFDEFNGKADPWDIYDTTLHGRWLKTMLPPFPF